MAERPPTAAEAIDELAAIFASAARRLRARHALSTAPPQSVQNRLDVCRQSRLHGADKAVNALRELEIQQEQP